MAHRRLSAPLYGKRLNDPTLTPVEVETIQAWASGADEHVSIVVPTGFTEDRWIVAAGNRKIVHHAHVFVIDPEQKAAAKKPDPAEVYTRWLHVRQGTES